MQSYCVDDSDVIVAADERRTANFFCLLPAEVLYHVLSRHLGTIWTLPASLVCRRWYRVMCAARMRHAPSCRVERVGSPVMSRDPYRASKSGRLTYSDIARVCSLMHQSFEPCCGWPPRGMHRLAAHAAELAHRNPAASRLCQWIVYRYDGAWPSAHVWRHLAARGDVAALEWHAAAPWASAQIPRDCQAAAAYAGKLDAYKWLDARCVGRTRAAIDYAFAYVNDRHALAQYVVERVDATEYKLLQVICTLLALGRTVQVARFDDEHKLLGSRMHARAFMNAAYASVGEQSVSWLVERLPALQSHNTVAATEIARAVHCGSATRLRDAGTAAQGKVAVIPRDLVYMTQWPLSISIGGHALLYALADVAPVVDGAGGKRTKWAPSDAAVLQSGRVDAVAWWFVQGGRAKLHGGTGNANDTNGYLATPEALQAAIESHSEAVVAFVCGDARRWLHHVRRHTVDLGYRGRSMARRFEHILACDSERVAELVLGSYLAETGTGGRRSRRTRRALWDHTVRHGHTRTMLWFMTAGYARHPRDPISTRVAARAGQFAALVLLYQRGHLIDRPLALAAEENVEAHGDIAAWLRWHVAQRTPTFLAQSWW